MFVQLDNVSLPEIVDGYLGYMRLRITEDIAWLHGSSMYLAMSEGGGGTRPSGDKSLVQVTLYVQQSNNPLHA